MQANKSKETSNPEESTVIISRRIIQDLVDILTDSVVNDENYWSLNKILKLRIIRYTLVHSIECSKKRE